MTIAIERPGLVVHQGDALAVLRTLGSESVHCCVTSPPYLGLRRYVAPGDPDAALEVGQEATPAAFVARLVEIFREVRRVLRSDGTCWIVMGDSYNSGAQFNHHKSGLHQNSELKGVYNESPDGAAWSGHRAIRADIPPKSLLLVPERLAIALSDDGWIVRSKIRWCKVACMPESVADRPTSAVEEILMLAKSPRYFYDAEAVRETALHEGRVVRASGGGAKNAAGATEVNDRRTAAGFTTHDTVVSGRNMRNYWLLSPAPFSSAKLGVVGTDHYAAFPPDLPRRCIAAGTSDKGVCPKCAAPWARVVERSVSGARHVSPKDVTHPTQPTHATARLHGQYFDSRVAFTGWAPTCACADPRPPVPATVLDPFFGSGTTGKVATAMGRACVGIELNAAYIPILAARNAQAGMGFFDDEGAAS